MRKVLAVLAFAVSVFFLICSLLGIVFTYEAYRFGQLSGLTFQQYALRTEILIAVTAIFFFSGQKIWPKRMG
jgi:hypothetical protein